MRGNSSTNLVNKEVSVQAVLKIYLPVSKLRHYIFQRKMRVHTLRIWKREAKRGPGKSQF